MRVPLLALALAMLAGASMAAEPAGDHSIVTLPRTATVPGLGSPLQLVPASSDNARPATSVVADYRYPGMSDRSSFRVEVTPVGPLNADQAVAAVQERMKGYEDSVRTMVEKGAVVRQATRFKPDLPLLKPPAGEPVPPESTGIVVYFEQKGVVATSVVVVFYRNMHLVRVTALAPESVYSPNRTFELGTQFATAMSRQMDLRNFGSCSRAAQGDALQRWRNRCAATKEELQASKQGPEFVLKRG